MLAVLGVLTVPLVGGAGWLLIGGSFRGTRADLLTHQVQSERLELTIIERGALEAVENSEISCKVKSGSKGSSFSTTIKWVIEDGSHVKAGDKLVDFDKSALEDQLSSQEITRTQAQADVAQAKGNLTIVLSQNRSDEKTAEVSLQLAILDEKKYLDGDYPQLIKDIQGRRSIAESDLEMMRDRAAWSERMVKKGFMSPSQSQAEQSRLRYSEITLSKVEEELRVLNQYTRDRTMKDLQNKVMEAERTLERVKIQADAKKKQAEAEAEAKDKILKQAVKRFREIEEEIKNCTIHAPQDGMVVYYVNENSRYSSGSQRTGIIAQGEPVSEGQKLMRIPDLKNMQVNTRVHEALVSRVYAGQQALIRVDAFPSRQLRGHVKQVATVASQADYFSSDVKVYQTMVAVDELVEGIKPGMSAEVTILVEGALDRVLTVPVQAIYGAAELGKSRKCLVLTPAGHEEREIVLGVSNDKMAEVKSGLKEGEQVVINPKAILGDKIRTRLPAAERPAGQGWAPENKGPPEGKGEPKGKAPPGEKGPITKGKPGEKAGKIKAAE